MDKIFSFSFVCEEKDMIETEKQKNAVFNFVLIR